MMTLRMLALALLLLAADGRLTLRLASSDHRDALSVYALIPPDAANWRVAVSLSHEGGVWGTGSQRALNGADAERSHLFTFRYVPRGKIYIVASLYNRSGRVIAQAERTVFHSP
jgi:hypothetical protein